MHSKSAAGRPWRSSASTLRASLCARVGGGETMGQKEGRRKIRRGRGSGGGRGGCPNPGGCPSRRWRDVARRVGGVGAYLPRHANVRGVEQSRGVVVLDPERVHLHRGQGFRLGAAAGRGFGVNTTGRVDARRGDRDGRREQRHRARREPSSRRERRRADATPARVRRAHRPGAARSGEGCRRRQHRVSSGLTSTRRADGRADECLHLRFHVRVERITITGE